MFSPAEGRQAAGTLRLLLCTTPGFPIPYPERRGGGSDRYRKPVSAHPHRYLDDHRMSPGRGICRLILFGVYLGAEGNRMHPTTVLSGKLSRVPASRWQKNYGMRWRGREVGRAVTESSVVLTGRMSAGPPLSGSGMDRGGTFMVGLQAFSMIDSRRCLCSSSNLSLLASWALIMSPKRRVTLNG